MLKAETQHSINSFRTHHSFHSYFSRTTGIGISHLIRLFKYGSDAFFFLSSSFCLDDRDRFGGQKSLIRIRPWWSIYLALSLHFYWRSPRFLDMMMTMIDVLSFLIRHLAGRYVCCTYITIVFCYLRTCTIRKRKKNNKITHWMVDFLREMRLLT